MAHFADRGGKGGGGGGPNRSYIPLPRVLYQDPLMVSTCGVEVGVAPAGGLFHGHFMVN